MGRDGGWWWWWELGLGRREAISRRGAAGGLALGTLLRSEVAVARAARAESERRGRGDQRACRLVDGGGGRGCGGVAVDGARLAAAQYLVRWREGPSHVGPRRRRSRPASACQRVVVATAHEVSSGWQHLLVTDRTRASRTSTLAGAHFSRARLSPCAEKTCCAVCRPDPARRLWPDQRRPA